MLEENTLPTYRTHERFGASDQAAIEFHLILAGLRVDEANQLTIEELQRRQPRAPQTMAVAAYVYGTLQAKVTTPNEGTVDDQEEKQNASLKSHPEPMNKQRESEPQSAYHELPLALGIIAMLVFVILLIQYR